MTRIKSTNTLRYLGFHFDARLNWKHHVDVACNRACASLKALQLLGNSVRGLDQARWWLAYNAICLPVLTYGCQLWFTGKQVTLVKKMQTVQNDAVKIMLGSFRTAPREALHHLLTVFPMDLRLNMIIKNTALHLYRAPKDSQLLRRLGSTWHVPTPEDLPLPAPARNKAKTTLRSLAARVPSTGPRINSFPNIPAGAPDWNGRIRTIPKLKDGDYEQINNTLTTACNEGFAVNIFCDGMVSNKDHADNKQLGAASAVLYHEGKEFSHYEKVFGETLTKSDTLICSLSTALEVLSLFLSCRPAHAHIPTVIAIPSAIALDRALDASPHEEQNTALGHLYKLGELFNAYPTLKITLQWLPRTIPFVGFRRGKQLSLEAIRIADLTTIKEPHTIRQQQDATRSEATATWGDRFYQAPRSGLSYKTALLAPPDGGPHPTFQPPHPPLKTQPPRLLTTHPHTKNPKKLSSLVSHTQLFTAS